MDTAIESVTEGSAATSPCKDLRLDHASTPDLIEVIGDLSRRRSNPPSRYWKSVLGKEILRLIFMNSQIPFLTGRSRNK